MRPLRLPLRWLGAASLVGMATLMAAGTATSEAHDADDSPFLEANKIAMSRMMEGMDIVPSGDADRDFAAMMIAHHQGAIEMARAELGYGHNERLRRIAQGIIVEQQQEIEAMRLSLGSTVPTSSGVICSSHRLDHSAPPATEN